MLLSVRIDTESGNRAISGGTIEKVIGAFAEQAKPEAAYFYSDPGKRAASFIFDMADSSLIPPMVEPFFIELNAECSLTPVMNLDDLKKGLALFMGPG